MINNVAKFLQESAEILNQLVFDKAMGQFTIPNQNFKSMYLFCEAFGVTNSTIQTHLDTCSVCYDKTITKTSCDHVLCIPCWSSIKRTANELDDDRLGNDYNTKKCPICRQELYI